MRKYNGQAMRNIELLLHQNTVQYRLSSVAMIKFIEKIFIIILINVYGLKVILRTHRVVAVQKIYAPN